MQAWTRQQLVKLALEAKTLADWITVRDFATQIYGEGKAVKVEIETYGEYNDEGSTDYSVDSVTAYDKDGKRLAYDLSLPFWKQSDLLKEYLDGDEDEDDLQEAARQALKEWYPWKDEEKALIKRQNWVKWGDLPVDVHEGEDETYDLTVMPELSLP